MSYILEALKKSSEERARLTPVDATPGPALASPSPEGRMFFSPWWWIAGAGVSILVVIVFIGIKTDTPGPDQSQSRSPITADSTYPDREPVRLDAPPASATVAIQELPPTPPVPAKPVSVAPEVKPQRTPSESAVQSPAPAQTNTQAPAARVHAAYAPVANRAPVAAAPAPAVPASVSSAPEPVPASVPAPNTSAEMPPDLMKQVLAIPISAHIYSSKPADRMVIIDGRAVREGDVLPLGVTIEQITPSGIAVTYKGYRANRPVH
jgi:hypothetical protein